MKTELENKFVSVAAIENGTVVDHIDARMAVMLLRFLKLERHQKPVTVGLNLPSSRMKTKDMIKVEGWELSETEASQIAIFAPNATLSIIKDFQVIKKEAIQFPETIAHVMICPNEQCVSNHEETSRLFYVSNERKEVQLRCHYCERSFFKKEITNYAI